MDFSPCLPRKRAPDGLVPLPVDEKNVSWCWRALEMSFSPARRRKERLVDISALAPLRQAMGDNAACARNTLSHLPVEEKYPQKCSSLTFPPCLSRKRPFHEEGPMHDRSWLLLWSSPLLAAPVVQRGNNVFPAQQTSLQFVVKSVCKPRMPMVSPACVDKKSPKFWVTS